jgi:hypothetical protein
MIIFIYYKDNLKYNIVFNEKWISLNTIETFRDNYSQDSIFNNKEFPLEHILYYFDEYKDKSKIINWVISEISMWWYSNTIQFFPWKKEKEYIDIKYVWHEYLITKYMKKNNCYKRNEDWVRKNFKECYDKSVLDHYLDSKITINLIKSPSFIKLKKDEKWIDYFEIDLENNDFDSVWMYWLEFEIFLNWQKKWFSKKIIIKILKPTILIVWELWPDWWTIYNNWKDISISVEKWKLDKKYKIAKLASDEWNFSFISSKEFSKIPDWSSVSYYFDSKIPNIEILYNNYLSWVDYWTTISKDLNNTDVKNYNKCILDKNKTDKEKYICFKKYMWFPVKNNKYSYVGEKLKCSKIKDLDSADLKRCASFFLEKPFNPAIRSSSLKDEEKLERLIKKIEKLENKLKNNPKFWKIIPKIEKLIYKTFNKKILSIDKKIWKIPTKVRNNKRYKDILDYLEAKIKLEIIKRDIK